MPLSHIRSRSKEGLTATVVTVQRWSGSRVTLMLSLTGRIRTSSLFPQYLITAMFVGVCAVTMYTHFSAAITKIFPQACRDCAQREREIWRERERESFQVIKSKSNKEKTEKLKWRAPFLTDYIYFILIYWQNKKKLNYFFFLVKPSSYKRRMWGPKNRQMQHYWFNLSPKFWIEYALSLGSQTKILNFFSL